MKHYDGDSSNVVLSKTTVSGLEKGDKAINKLDAITLAGMAAAEKRKGLMDVARNWKSPDRTEDKMTKEKAIEILKEYQLWRHGIHPYDQGGEDFSVTPEDIGKAIDIAIGVLEQKTK